ncbi:conserved hypothetical protein [Neospora caninum Liverpool]|uniref:Uncharacterized protein n=1 Tax=Neospora caninum (strain Liverpool) TaxID=572307 RepID=F0VK03_NEOCL|nr:conserved hypothetical protein [Neospora caninum Liverpool]CBZ53233.1 conserved hypothetical protein [Neospora caninum Liverpool]CEL67223.1 TPA: hypothetical protein BN1204_030200 [Neospora caninum Liverpool]|eukprot:XP_003883265.1 conserved hypothetical protein [Neospora caninum Liverpool]
MMYPLSCHEEHIQFPYPFISPPRSLPGPPPGKSRDIFDPLKRRADSHGVLGWLLDARNNLRHCPECPPRQVWGRVLSMVPDSARERAKSDTEYVSEEILRRREHQRELRRRLRERHQELEREAQQNAPSEDGTRALSRRAAEKEPARAQRPDGLLSLALFLRKNGDLLRTTRLRPTPRGTVQLPPEEDSDGELGRDTPNLSDPESYTLMNSDDEVCILRLGNRLKSPADCTGVTTLRKNSQGSTVSSSRSRGKDSIEIAGPKRGFLSPEDGQSRLNRGFLSNVRQSDARQSSEELFVTAWSHNDEDGARLVVPSRFVSTYGDSTEDGERAPERGTSRDESEPEDSSRRPLTRSDSSCSVPGEDRNRFPRFRDASELVGDNAPLSPLPRGYGTKDKDRKRSGLFLDPRHLEKALPCGVPPFFEPDRGDAASPAETCGRFQSVSGSRGSAYTPAETGDADPSGSFPSNHQQLRPLNYPFPLSPHAHHVSLPSFSRLPEHPFSPASACTPTQKVLPYTLKDLPDSPGPQKRLYRPANSKIRRGTNSVEKRARDASTRRWREAGCSVSRRRQKTGRPAGEKRRPPVALPVYRQSPSPGGQLGGRKPVGKAADGLDAFRDRGATEWTEYRRFLEQRLREGGAREDQNGSNAPGYGHVTRIEFRDGETQRRPVRRLDSLGSAGAAPARGSSGESGNSRTWDRARSEDAGSGTGRPVNASFCGWIMSGSSSSDGLGRYVGSLASSDR